MKKYFLIFTMCLCALNNYGLSYAKPDPAEGKEYRISVNDLLEINVYQEPDLTKTVRVAVDGNISYPLLGSIQVKGLTAKELETEITNLLKEDFLVNPQVSVFVKEHAKISVLGQVRKPGSYELMAGLTVMDAIALAGGFTEKANSTDIKLVRQKGEEKETIALNAEEIVEQGHKERDVELEPGDLVIVGGLSEVSSFVVVLGQVKSPGKYPYKKGMTVVQAVASAGGLADAAAPNGTRVIRMEEGRKRVIQVPLASILRGERNRDVTLKEDDTIVVPESFF